MSRRKPKPGRVVTVRWVDSGLTETGDPKDPRVGVLSCPTTHGRVLSCAPDPELRLPKAMDSTVLCLATNHSGPDDKQMDIFSILWSAVIDVKAGPK